jgi:hypothetical protein
MPPGPRRRCRRRPESLGDRWRDIVAWGTAGTLVVHVEREYRERRPEGPDLIERKLEEGVGWITEKLRR